MHPRRAIWPREPADVVDGATCRKRGNERRVLVDGHVGDVPPRLVIQRVRFPAAASDSADHKAASSVIKTQRSVPFRG